MQFLLHFSGEKNRKSDKDEDRKTIGVDHGGGADHIYIYILIVITSKYCKTYADTHF